MRVKLASTIPSVSRLDEVNDIENGRTNIPRFTIPEHAGVCTAGKVLINLRFSSFAPQQCLSKLTLHSAWRRLGRPSSQTTREEALKQVAMLQAAKEAAQATGR